MEKVFNIEYNKKKLTVQALNTAKNQVEAGKLLGVSQHTVSQWRRQFGIEWGGRKRGYYIPAEPEITRETPAEVIDIIRTVASSMNNLGKELSNYLKA